MRFSFLALLSLLVLGCSHSAVADRNPASGAADPFLWLEEVEGDKALDWVKAGNEVTFKRLKNERFAALEPEIRKILLAKDRLPAVSLSNGMLYNFWRDQTHVRGIWRRTTVESFKTAQPQWETVLDIDALARSENENWVWKGTNCLPPANNLCLISLSRGGKDAVVVREFDKEKKSFVAGGFYLEEAKSDVVWKDRDHLYVGTDFGPGTLTKSGYPFVAKLWRRGTSLSSARETFRGVEDDVSAYVYTIHRPEGTYVVKVRSPSFYESIVTLVNERGEDVPLHKQRDANLVGIMNGQIFLELRSDFAVAGKTFPRGSLLAMPLASAEKGEAGMADLKPVFTPTAKKILSGTSFTKDYVVLSVLDNVKGRIFRAEANSRGDWSLKPIPLGSNGMASVYSLDGFDNQALLTYKDFLTPDTIYLTSVDQVGPSPTALKSAPKRFDASDLVTHQYEAVSKDGTKVPYFIVHKKKMLTHGTNPTLLYGYGGFENSQTPYYLNATGKVWVEKGGVFVVANIRGGGEFGPRWHQAALKANRQKSFDDFIAVAEDLTRRKITSPRHLGIYGGSNGGLLVGAVMVQRPELFNAVVCSVPLLDMLRFHKLLAGASWMAEYGNPDVPAERAYIEKYSPYHNVRAGKRYPEAYFFTSTKDDRVHPGHARKMVAKMKSQGHPVLYFENTEGGHGGAANIEQSIYNNSLMYSYLWEKLDMEYTGK